MPGNLSVRFFRILRAPLSHLRKRQNEDGPRAPAHEAGAGPSATAHERTPQQERQKAARERPSAAVRLDARAGHEKARSGLLRASDAVERGRGCCLAWLCCSEWVAPGSGPDHQSSPFLGPSTFLTITSFRQSIDNHPSESRSNAVSDRLRRRRLSRPATAARAEPVLQRCRCAAGIAVAGLLLKHGPNSEVADCHQRIDGVPGRKTRLAEEARSCASAVSICGAPGRVPAWMRAIAVGEQRACLKLQRAFPIRMSASRRRLGTECGDSPGQHGEANRASSSARLFLKCQ